MKRIRYAVGFFCLILMLSACSTKGAAKSREQFPVNGIGETYSLATNVSWSEEWIEIQEDFNDVVQKMEIYTATDELVLTFSQNEQIFYFIKNLEYDKWDYSVKRIPPQATKLCLIVGYLEQNDVMVEQGRDTVYYDEDGYYMLSETIYDMSSQTKMSDNAGLFLIQLCGMDRTTESVTFEDEHENTATDSNNYNTEQYLPFPDITYDGMLWASKSNRIDINVGGIVVQSISDNEEIFSLLMSLDTTNWSYIDNIPDSKEICAIVFFQEGRRDHAGQMWEQWRQVLYFDGANYYVDMLTGDNGHAIENFNELYPQHYLIPTEVGEMLSNRLTQLNN